MPEFNKAFKKWFGDSKVVNADGSPKVVYHGTSAQFDIFEPQYDKGVGVLRNQGTFPFSDNLKTAKSFIDWDHDQRVISAFLSLQNPADYRDRAQIESIVASILQAERDGVRFLDSQQARLLGDGGDLYALLELRTQMALSDDVVEIEDPLERIIQFATSGDYGFFETTGMADALKRFGFDGWITTERQGTTYAAFYPEQIKSIENDGTWDPSDPNIMSNPDDRLPPGFSGFDVPDEPPKALTAADLMRRGIFVDARPGVALKVAGVRFVIERVFSPHEAMAKKVGAKRKMFNIWQQDTVTVREQKGAPDTTAAMPVVLEDAFEDVLESMEE